MAITLPAKFSEFVGRRLLRVFTSHDRTKLGFEFEQRRTSRTYRYIFSITGTIDSVAGITDILGHNVTSTAGISLDPLSGQEGFVLYTDKGRAVFELSPDAEYGNVVITYTVEDKAKAPYGSVTEYIVQEDDFDYGPSAGAVPALPTYYLLAAVNTPLVTEGGDNLVWRAA